MSASEPRADQRAANVWPFLADSRRSGDEIHPWPPNGGLRPILLKNYLVLDSPPEDGASRALLWSLLREKSFHVTVRAVVSVF